MAVRSDAAAHVRQFPAGRALALAWRLETRARAARWFARPAWTSAAVVALTALALLAIGAAWSTSHAQVAALLDLLQAHPFTPGLIGAWIAFLCLQAHRRRAERQHAASWLASAPIERRAVLAFLRRRAAVFVVPAGAMLMAALALLGWVDGRDMRLPCGLVGLGFAAGAIAGWRSGAHAPADAAKALPRLRAGASMPASSCAGYDALRRWPFAQLLASANPRQHARMVAAVLLTLPMGIPLSIAVPILLLLATGLGAVALQQALLTTIPRAADGLRSTPLLPARLIALLSGRVIACEIVAATFAGVLGRVLGASGEAALIGALAWLLWVGVALLCAFAARHRPTHLRAELAVIAIVLLALAAIAPLLLCVAVPAVAGWQSWRGWPA